jgi:hypothetical protein
MVSGHTITPSHRSVLTRCGAAYHMIDVGMSRAYHGSLAAWSCALGEGGGGAPQGEWARVMAHYPQGEGTRRRPRRAPPPLPAAGLL